MAGHIRIGIGGWTYAPWRGKFYPQGLTQARELEYAASQLKTIEINGTFYGPQKPATFAKWRDETPKGFRFAVKAPRYATHRSRLQEAGPTIERFLQGGVLELKEKLGPINWQLMPTTRFDAAQIEQFFQLLPKEAGRRELMHAIEVRHPSFLNEQFVALARRHRVAVITAGDAKYPQISDITANFAYLRIMGTQPVNAQGYKAADLKRWAERARRFATGRAPSDMPSLGPSPTKAAKTDVFLYVIGGSKELNPAAAQRLQGAIDRVGV